MTGLRIATTDGQELEARWDAPGRPRYAVVVCHAHPEHGGTMTAPLLERVTEVLTGAGAAVLRFNFRGVGGSTGTWGGGDEEVRDVAAAVRAAREEHPDLSLGLAGWSFGAVSGLRWQALSREPLPYVGIAPTLPDLPDPERLPPADRRLIIGDRDQFTEVEDLRAYATAAGAELEVLEGSDHFFYHREERVGDLVADWLDPGS